MATVQCLSFFNAEILEKSEKTVLEDSSTLSGMDYSFLI